MEELKGPQFGGSKCSSHLLFLPEQQLNTGPQTHSQPGQLAETLGLHTPASLLVPTCNVTQRWPWADPSPFLYKMEYVLLLSLLSSLPFFLPSFPFKNAKPNFPEGKKVFVT